MTEFKQRGSVMTAKTQLLIRLPLGVIVVPAGLFACAGSVKFWQGWVWLAVFLLPSLFFFFYLCRHDPKLLERRMRFREKIAAQNLVQVAGPLIMISCFVLGGLDYRFGWSRIILGPVPVRLTLVADAFVLGALLLIVWAMKVNSFAGRTIQVDAGQPVVSSGPYRLIRHPMYVGAIILSLANPLALASWIALPLSTLQVPLIVWRLFGEEKFLRRELAGYSAYCLCTRFRLIPLIW